MKKKVISKICFAASSGGHLDEISCLKPISESYDSFLVTECNEFQDVKIGNKTYYVRQINRKEKKFVFHLINLFIKSFFILIKENPQCIISTGALATFPISILAKCMRKKVIYIESFARVEKLSLAGKLMYYIADLFIVQWEELSNTYPKSIYRGGIF